VKADQPAVDLPLISLMRAEFQVGKWWWLGQLGLRLLALVVGVVAAAAGDRTVVIVSAMVGLLAVFFAYLCQRNSDGSQSLGEKTRRAIVLENGLGWTISSDAERSLRLRFSRWTKRIARGLKNPPDPYYASAEPPGPKRLLDNLKESIFWQAALCEKMAIYCLWAVGALVVLLVLTAWLALMTLQDQAAREVAAKLLAAVVAFLITRNTGDLWWSFHKVASHLRQIEAQAQELGRQRATPKLADVLKLVHEYDILLVQAPQVPDFVYWANRDELNGLWLTYNQ
jgi:hypothetical protein